MCLSAPHAAIKHETIITPLICFNLQKRLKRHGILHFPIFFLFKRQPHLHFIYVVNMIKQSESL